jgi:uncharacterized membrane protein
MALPFTNPSRSSWAVARNPLVWAPALALAAFLALPWSIEHKAHMALHGLCAQQVSHTYAFGDRLLPFDARMTGIYTGYLVTAGVLFATGAHRWCRPPALSRLVILALLGGAMAVDGLNSLFVDLGQPHLYAPRNDLRLITGALAGFVLAVGVCFLTASSVWSLVDTRKQTVESLRVAPAAGLAWLPLGLAVVSGWGFLYVPLTLLLITASALALTNLALVIIVILRRRDFTFASFESLGGYQVAALAAALATMAALAVGRSLLERSLGA